MHYQRSECLPKRQFLITCEQILKINLINSSYNKIKTQNHKGSGKKYFFEKKKIHFDSNFFRPFGATH